MPRLTAAEPTTEAPSVRFVFEPMLDMVNAMYFTSRSRRRRCGGLPVEIRKEMAPDLLEELDFLYSYPKGQPGLMGQLGDVLYAHPETWKSVGGLLAFVRGLPEGIGTSEVDPGIRGLAFYTACHYVRPEERRFPGEDPREKLRLELLADGYDPEDALRIFDRPEELTPGWCG